jgi:Flp pilus assembly protein TadD
MIPPIRHIVGFALLGFLVLARPVLADGQVSKDLSVPTILEDIDTAVQAGRLMQADAMLSWIEQQGDYAYVSRAAFSRAEYHMANGDAVLATKALNRAGKEAGDDCRRSKLSGWISGKTAQWNSAILQLASAVQNCPADAKLWNFLGLALIGKGEFSAAIEAFDSALALEPQHPALFNNRALALVGAGRNDSALADLNKALVLNADDAAIRDNADYLYGILGIEPVRTAEDSDAVWAGRLARTGDGARDAKRDKNANAYFANAALLMDRFDAHIWSQNASASVKKAD